LQSNLWTCKLHLLARDGRYVLPLRMARASASSDTRFRYVRYVSPKVVSSCVEVPSSGVEMVIIFAEMVINLVEVQRRKDGQQSRGDGWQIEEQGCYV
jgi:hypothetical protein